MNLLKLRLFNARKSINNFNLKIRKAFNNLNCKVWKFINNLPFATAARFVVNKFYSYILKTIHELNLEIGKGICKLYPAIKRYVFTMAIIAYRPVICKRGK